MFSISELLDVYEDERQRARDSRVGPSDYGRCRRQIAYTVEGVEPEVPIVPTRAATVGTLVHEALCDYIDSKGFPAWTRVPVEIPGLERDGEADVLWYFDGVLVDVKTLGGRAFEHVHARAEHEGQLETYALGLNRNGALGNDAHVHTLVLAYISRDDGDVVEFAWPYDEDSARRRVDWLSNVEHMIELGMEMPRDGDGPGLGFPCDWCPFVRRCWQTDDVPAGRSAVSQFTTTDVETESAIADYLEASEAESKAKRAKAAARERLVGISYQAGGYRLSWSRPKTEDVVDVEALTALAVERGLDVPMTEKRTASRISVKRVSADV